MGWTSGSFEQKLTVSKSIRNLIEYITNRIRAFAKASASLAAYCTRRIAGTAKARQLGGCLVLVIHGNSPCLDFMNSRTASRYDAAYSVHDSRQANLHVADFLDGF